jgi:hypothetical protein
VLISVEGTGKNQLESAREITGDDPVSSHFFFVKKYLTKNPTGVLEHCREGETNGLFSIYRWNFLLTASVRRRRISMYIYLLTAEIHISYTGEFRGLFLKLPTSNIC